MEHYNNDKDFFKEYYGAMVFGKAVIEEYQSNGLEVPSFVYEKMFNLYEEVIHTLLERLDVKGDNDNED